LFFAFFTGTFKTTGLTIPDLSARFAFSLQYYFFSAEYRNFFPLPRVYSDILACCGIFRPVFASIFVPVLPPAFLFFVTGKYLRLHSASFLFFGKIYLALFCFLRYTV